MPYFSVTINEHLPRLFKLVKQSMKFTKGQFLAALLRILGKLPLWACRLIGRLCGFFLWLIPNRSLNTTKINISACFPELGVKSKKKLIFNSLQHTGILPPEMAAIWSKPYSWLHKKIISIENEQLFTQSLSDKRGLIILAPHIGNWEVFSRYVPEHCSMMALYEPSKIQEVDKFIKQSRERTGAQLVPTSARGVASLLKFLKQGGTTCILPDQVPNLKDRSGVYAPFFGRPASTITLVNQLQQRTDAIVIAAAAKRVEGGFAIVFHGFDDDIYDTDPIISATAMNKGIEHLVNQMPEQYQWEYKRFRRQPEGTEKLY